MTERLLDDDPPPAAGLVVVGHAGALHLLEHDGERGRRDRQVERGVALDAVAGLELGRGRGAACRRPRRRRRRQAGTAASCDTASRRLRGTRCGSASRPTSRASDSKSPTSQSRRAKPSSTKPGRQQAAVGQVVDRRDQLLAGQVAGDAEDDDRARPGTRGSRRSRGSRSGLPADAGQHASSSASGGRRRGAASIPAARSVRWSRTTGRTAARAAPAGHRAPGPAAAGRR